MILAFYVYLRELAAPINFDVCRCRFGQTSANHTTADRCFETSRRRATLAKRNKNILSAATPARNVSVGRENRCVPASRTSGGGGTGATV